MTIVDEELKEQTMRDTQTLSNSELDDAIDATYYRLTGLLTSASDKDKDLLRQHLSSLLAAQANRAHGNGPVQDDEHVKKMEADEYDIPYIEDDGTLKSWAKYVATDGSNDVAWQYSALPFEGNYNWVKPLASGAVRAPDHYAILDRHWSMTLRRVRRRET